MKDDERGSRPQIHPSRVPVWRGSLFDVLIIGGGINGCGIARDCALRGLKTALVEKEDFGAGASGNSSGFIHGGMRYLLSDRKVTKKSSLDAGYIRRIAPHLVARTPIALPTARRGLAGWYERTSVEAFFSAYDAFAKLRGGRPHVWLTGSDLAELEPGLVKGLTGAAVTDEWWVDAPRLCLVNALAAAEAGADVRNHARVTGVKKEGGRIRAVAVKDGLTGSETELEAKVFVNAAGPWLSRVAGLAGATARIRPGKGVHLVLEKRVTSMGVITTAIDGRHIFVIPAGRGSLIGTTDDDFYGDPDRLSTTEDEIEYLLQGIEAVLPGIRDVPIVRTTVGLRPTLHAWGKLEDALSRDHAILEHPEAPEMLTIAGGKLAAYRLMSEEVTDAVCRRLQWKEVCRTHTTPLPGGEPAAPATAPAGMEADIEAGIRARHGSRAGKVFSAEGMKRLCPSDTVTEAEVRYVTKHEWVRTLSDLARRTGLGLERCAGADCAPAAADVLASELGWDAPTRALRLEEFLRERQAAIPGSRR